MPESGDLGAIVFDFDGTLADTEDTAHRPAYNDAFRSLGLGYEWDSKLYAELLAVAGGKERIAIYLERFAPEVSAAARPELVERIHHEKQRAFARYAPAVPLRPGVRRLIDEAHAVGIKVAIATTAAESGVLGVLDARGGLREKIDVVAAGDVVEQKKPAPDVYLYACERLGVPPARCVAVEDSAVGLRAALAAGLVAVVTVNPQTEREDFTGAATIVSDLGEPGAEAMLRYGSPLVNGTIDLTYLRHVLALGSAAAG